MKPGRLLLGGAVGLVLLFLVLPLAIIVPMSFSGSRFLAFPPPSWSVRWFQAYFNSASWMAATRVSLVIGVLTVAIATPLGVAAAYAIDRSRTRLMRLVSLMLMLPLIVPIIIVAIGLYFAYARLGLVATLPGLVLANVMLGLPYVVTSTLSGLQSFDPAQEMVARSLGMNRFRAFMAVTLPQIRPSVIAGAVFAFISAIDETVIALFVSGGQYQPLTKRMFTALRDEIDPTIAAISTLLTVTSFVLVLGALQLRKRAA